MSKQLHKRLSEEQVKVILGKYVEKEIKAKEAIAYLEISRARFYQLVESYHKDPDGFSIEYSRSTAPRRLDPEIEKNILKELAYEKEHIIDNPDVPTRWYNYSYIQQLVKNEYDQSVSVPTIINRAKEHGYWKGKPPRKIHDREVVTNYTGELIQHDTSIHLWAPDSKEKWYLITSLDDYSRMLLYAKFMKKESTWQHILALQQVFLDYGIPFQYYVDQHSIFRYVKDRDKFTPWNTYTVFTGDTKTQWEQVLDDCSVKPIYALSPQAKGKIERPYEWLQDHIVRTCVRQGVTDMTVAQAILNHEVAAYNTKKVHSTTGEIPLQRFQKAMNNDKTLFRKFKLQPNFQSIKDIFCLRITRTVDSYRNVSVKNFKMRVPSINPHEEVELRLYPDFAAGLIEVRIWHQVQFISSQKVKITDMPIVQF